MVKNGPTVQETWVQSLGAEDPLGEENGNPLEYSCLENSSAFGDVVKLLSELQCALSLLFLILKSEIVT